MREITGKHVLAITVSAFAVIIGVNVLMAWTLTPDYDATAKEMRLVFTDKDGMPVAVKDLAVLIGRTTSSAEDTRPGFVREAGAYVAKADLGAGKWMMQIEARAEDGTLFRQRIDLSVKG